MSIALIRVDDRLIHGQVVMTWIRHIQCTHIKIIDDKTASDEFMCKLLTSIGPSGIGLDILTIEKAVESYPQWISSKENVMVIVKTPITLKEMSSFGIEYKAVNIGGSYIGPGRKKFHKNIAFSDEERLYVLELVRQGVDVYYQMAATERREPITEKMFK